MSREDLLLAGQCGLFCCEKHNSDSRQDHHTQGNDNGANSGARSLIVDESIVLYFLKLSTEGD
jgi:hypothetical protein